MSFHSSVSSRKQLILSCLDSVIADFRRTSCAPAADLHSFLGQFVGSRVGIWNNLDNNVKLSIDVNSFRYKLTGTLLDKFKRE